MTQTQEPSVPTGDTPFVPIEKIVSLCKRRGFVYPNSEIYGGVSGIYDFGPLGVELRNNIRRYWWWSMVQTNDNVVGIEGAIITHPRVWEAIDGRTVTPSSALVAANVRQGVAQRQARVTGFTIRPQ